MVVTSKDVEKYMSKFLSRLDDKGRELMTDLHPELKVVDYGDLIVNLGISRTRSEINDSDYLYLLSSEPIVSHFWKIADGTKSPIGGYHVMKNLPKFMIQCLFYSWDTRSEGEVINTRSIRLTKSCYPLVNAAVTAYEACGDGKIKEDDMVKIKDWMSRNGPIVKSSFKQ